MSRTIDGMIDSMLAVSDLDTSLILAHSAPHDILVSAALRLIRAALNAVNGPVVRATADARRGLVLDDSVRGRMDVHLRGTEVKTDPLLPAWGFLSAAVIETLTETFQHPGGPSEYLEQWAHDPVLLQNRRRDMIGSFGMPIERLHSTLFELWLQFEALNSAAISKNYRAEADRVEAWRSDSARSLSLLFGSLEPFCGKELARAS